MWDEHERFAKGVSKIFTGLLGALGLVLIAASLATGIPDFFLAYLLVLGLLATIVLVYGLVAGIVGGVLIGISCGVNYGLRRLRLYGSSRPAGR